MPVTHVTVQHQEAGQKIMQFLQRRVGRDVPRSALMRVIRKGQVRVDGRRVKPFDRVAQGQQVRIPPFFLSASNRDQGGMDRAPVKTVPLLYQDEDMLVVNKPAGLPVHPGTGWTDSVVTRLAGMFPEAPLQPVPVHRLDKQTSGVLLVARAHHFLRQMQEIWKEGGVTKIYLAWVHGLWDQKDSVLLEDRVTKTGLQGREKMHTGSGKQAVCRVQGLGTHRGCSLVAIRLMTGRTHQIRVQLASRGFPLVGDRKYGGKAHECMLLHAWSLSWGEHCFRVCPPWNEPFQAEKIMDSWTRPDGDVETGRFTV
jgi:23S rRNA pseudouridine955/2504/2580 synthase